MITGLVTVFPFGGDILEFVWGGAFCRMRTVNRFLSLHILLPIIVMGVIIIHLITLHGFVSGIGGGDNEKILFTGLLSKDGINIVSFVMLIMLIVFVPNYFMDAEN